MSTLDRRLFLRAALGVAAAAAIGLPMMQSEPAEAATLPMLKPLPEEATEPLVEKTALIIRRRRRRGPRIIIRRPRRRRLRRCWRNRRGRLVCVIR